MSTISKQMNEQEKIEELLKTRYEVISDYPGSKLKAGHVISEEEAEELFDFPHNILPVYPNIFRLLAWWEKREASEMEAIKYIRWNEHQIKFNGEDKNEVMKVESVRICNPGGSMAGMFEFVVERTIPGKENNKYNYPQLSIPATSADYNQYRSVESKEEPKPFSFGRGALDPEH